jgi:virginiamycin B lyase
MSNHWMLRVAIVLAAAAALMTMGASAFAESPTAAHDVAVSTSSDSHIFLFDSTTSAFVFTFTLPTLNAQAWDIEAVPGGSATEVWVTAPGADQIGRLVYTSTSDYTYEQVQLPLGTYPLNLAVDDAYVWFTAPGRNLVGRLSRQDHGIEEFPIPTANSYPADLDIASDGSVWFTQMYADQVARLVVTSTAEYQITEYSRPLLQGGRPYGIVVKRETFLGNDIVYLALSRSNAVVYFEPSSSPEVWVSLKWVNAGETIPNGPYRLASRPAGGVWTTERRADRVTWLRWGGTTPSVHPYPVDPPQGLLNGLDVDASGNVWFAQERAGRIGRLIASFTPQKTTYPLPVADLAPRSVVSDGEGGIWVVAVKDFRLYLPAIFQSG